MPSSPSAVAIIEVILQLAETNGATSQQIFDFLPSVCPDFAATRIDQLEASLAAGSRRGLFLRAFESPTSVVTYYGELLFS